MICYMKNSKHSRPHKYEFLKEICETYSTINETSIKNIFLQYYKNQVSLSDNNLNNIIKKERFAFLNGQDCFGNTPLMYVCQGGYEEIVKYLIEKGANINAKNNKGETPLIYVCKNNYVDKGILDYLIKEGADINARNKKDIAPIILCCYKRKYTYVKYLIELGANVNEIDKDGGTVLMNCLQFHNYEEEMNIVEYLIEKGADIYARNNNGNTPLMIATFNWENYCYYRNKYYDYNDYYYNEVIMNYLRGYK
eukprot:jgi/Orpsp1_1/1180983/evm.model.c7180000075357.1